jgi:5-aminolevulinate synthase
MDHNTLREQHQLQATKLKEKLAEAGIEIHPNCTTHIVPVMVRDPLRCKKLSDVLLEEHGIYCQSINYPTVEEGTERLRFAPTPLHTDAMISELVDSLRKVLNEH